MAKRAAKKPATASKKKASARRKLRQPKPVEPFPELLACPRCGKVVAKRFADGSLKDVCGALVQQPKQAPKLRCPCGLLIVFLEGRG